MLRVLCGSSPQRVELLRSPRLIAVDLVATAAQPDAQARIFWDVEDYRCYLHAVGLRPPQSGHALVLWVTDESGRVIRAGRVEPAGGGEAGVFVALPRDSGRMVRATVTEEAVTEEADAASDRPSGVVQLEWRATS